jgi:hypothetical protein
VKLKGYSGDDITHVCRSVAISRSAKEWTGVVGMKAGWMLLDCICIAQLPSKNAGRDGFQWNESQNTNDKELGKEHEGRKSMCNLSWTWVRCRKWTRRVDLK